jgi:hypothetical protein
MMMGSCDRYILDSKGSPVQCFDIKEWAEWFGDFENRVIMKTQATDEAVVSTMFLGVDRNYTGTGAPILFETMIFGGIKDGEQRRYATREEALNGHWQMVDLAQEDADIVEEISLTEDDDLYIGIQRDGKIILTVVEDDDGIYRELSSSSIEKLSAFIALHRGKP